MSSESGKVAQKDDATRFVGDIPHYYDQGMGPIIFADYAEIAAERVASFRPRAVLETAAGTGIVTRALRTRLPAEAQLTATDLNAPMLEVARGKFAPGEKVTFRPADALDLPFPDAAFDIVLCQFGVMFYPDKDKSYREARRVLTPGGRYIFSVWDSLEHNPFGNVVAESLAAAFKTDPPPFFRVPFGYSAIDPIKTSLLDAGFRDIRIDVLRLDKQVSDCAAFAKGLVLGGPVADQIRARGADPEGLIEAVEISLRERVLKQGHAPLQAILFEARVS
jgi:ubiquinone/menaquinone biosynthesis C-methylase UbiE